MKTNTLLSIVLLLACAIPGLAGHSGKKKVQTHEPSPLEIYTHDAAQQAQEQPPTEGSLWTPLSQFADLGRDLKASQVNDLVTILVSEQASAVSTGATQTSRNSSVATSVTGLATLEFRE